MNPITTEESKTILELEHSLNRFQDFWPRIEAYDERLTALERKEIKMNVILERICSDVAEIKKDLKHMDKRNGNGGSGFGEKLIWELVRLLGIAIAVIASVLGLKQFL